MIDIVVSRTLDLVLHLPFLHLSQGFCIFPVDCPSDRDTTGITAPAYQMIVTAKKRMAAASSTAQLSPSGRARNYHVTARMLHDLTPAPRP